MKPIEIYAKMYEDHTYDGWAKLTPMWAEIKTRYPLFGKDDLGTEVGAGWWPLLEETFAELTKILEQWPGVLFRVDQIKEKFGGLRFYYHTRRANGSTITDEALEDVRKLLDAVVMQAEGKASQTCEICGEPGERRSLSWLKTLCDKHYTIANERAKKWKS